MNKYKLIKKFPNSPRLGFIASQEDDGYYSGGIEWSSPQKEIESYPEFWEKVIEKDYEILIFKRNGGHYDDTTFTLTKKGKYDCSFRESNLSLEHCLNGEFKIYSVKRLSDNVIFTIGNKVKDSLTDNLTNFKTQEIVYFNKGNKIICNAKSGTTMPLSTIRHIKKPLFTTEDGVEVFRMNMYYPVNKKDNTSTRFYNALEESSHFIPMWKRKEYVFFSTKEKAEEYILMNKPCLSLKDVANIISFENSYFKEIKLLVKNKLKE